MVNLKLKFSVEYTKYFHNSIDLMKHQSNTSDVGIKFQIITVSLSLRRRSLYFMIYLIAPSFIISILSILGFILPPEGGEKASFRMLKFEL